MIVQQMLLASGTQRLMAWIEPKAKPGDLVTLKNSDDPGQWWKVLDSFGVCEVSSINRGWNNNI